MSKLMNCRCADRCSSTAPLVLRVVTGLIFLLHGMQKLQGGTEGVVGFFSGIGIPAAAFFAPLVIWFEIIGGAALILGILTHWVSKLFLLEMLVAILTAHAENGFFVSSGGMEFALLLAASMFVLMAMGPGKWAIDNKWRRSSSMDQ